VSGALTVYSRRMTDAEVLELDKRLAIRWRLVRTSDGAILAKCSHRWRAERTAEAMGLGPSDYQVVKA
jgi:hypothetical protein